MENMYLIDRVSIAESFVFERFNGIPDQKWRTRAIYHSHAVSLLCVLFARKRGLDPEIAAIAGLLHDFYAYEQMDYTDHAHRGAVRAGEVLEERGWTTEEEKAQIMSAIYHHDDLMTEDDPMDELLKDADLIDNAMSNPSRAVRPDQVPRIAKICRELGLPFVE